MTFRDNHQALTMLDPEFRHQNVLTLSDFICLQNNNCSIISESLNEAVVWWQNANICHSQAEPMSTFDAKGDATNAIPAPLNDSQPKMPSCIV